MRSKQWIFPGWIVVLMAALLTGPADAQIPKKDFYGTWRMVHDGWEGTLILRGTMTAAGINGHYIGGDGKEHAVSGSVDDYMITLRIDLNDTDESSDDQEFEGYIFTQSRTGMAGTTWWANKPFGWYAVKVSDSTELPKPPGVTTDHPEPEKWEEMQEEPVVQMESVGLSLSTSKVVYAQGEEVAFRLQNTGTKNIDLKMCYYVIQYREDNQGIEFYTSRREPFQKLSLASGDTISWKWNQWDNEHQNRARPGEWRIIFYAPRSPIKPLSKAFKIQ